MKLRFNLTPRFAPLFFTRAIKHTKPKSIFSVSTTTRKAFTLMYHAVDLPNNKIFHNAKAFFHKMLSDFIVQSKKAIPVKYADVHTFRYRIRIQVPDVTQRNLPAAAKGALY